MTFDSNDANQKIKAEHDRALRPCFPIQTPVYASQKPLLSEEIKKANHIESEKKRRANIKIGYRKLASHLPALTESATSEARILEHGKHDLQVKFRG